MPSPFPGMNPYIEHPSIWRDFLKTFIPFASEAINKQILPRYYSKIAQEIYVHDLTDNSHRLGARFDLSKGQRHLEENSANAEPGLLTAPAQVTMSEFEIENIPYLEVVDRESMLVVTVIELLSPEVKLAGKDRDQYVSRARKLIWTKVNFVEIDLLRCGLRTHWIGMPSCDYSVIVSRAEQSPKAGLWPVQLRDRLPVIPVPLRTGDADAQLDLQQLLHRIYDSAGYSYYIYRNSPDPALSPEDAEWAKSLIP